VPAYNVERAYSAQETDTFAFPAYKSFQLFDGDAGQLSERPAGDRAADETELVPVHDGADVRVQIEVLRGFRGSVALAWRGCASSEAGSPTDFFEAPQLVKMMADVDDVEPAPLIGAQGTEDKMGAMPLQAEAGGGTDR